MMQTREEWLNRAVALMAEELGPRDLDWSRETKQPLVDAVRVSIGYPRRRRYADKNCLGGDCLPAHLSKDNVHEIFIPPTIENAADALDILEHQIGHVVIAGSPHIRNRDLAPWHSPMLLKLGPLPHAQVTTTEKKADTRLLLAQCPNIGCSGRTSRGPWQFRITKARAQQGLPFCPCEGCGAKVELAWTIIAASKIDIVLGGTKE